MDMNKSCNYSSTDQFRHQRRTCPVLIPFLKKLKFGQQVRDDGPQAHLKKPGTPTMGGWLSWSA